MANEGYNKKEEESTDIPLIKSGYEENNGRDLERANFETAITETNFGKFNILLILITIFPSFSQVFETVSMSYVLPIAQCDLNLTLEDKGRLNAMAFAGMITSSFFWGYLCDTRGRKKIIVTGYILVGFFVLMASLSHNITLLMISKFFGGLIIHGPFAAATSYLAEFHSSKFRARIQLVRGIFVSLANTALPLLAWIILPRDIDVGIYGYRLRSWNVFLVCCALVPFTSGLAYIFMPESPRFLMTTGRNDKALKVFQKIYKTNTGNPRDTYPIKMLVEETIQKEKRKKDEPKLAIDHKPQSKTRDLIAKWLNQVKPLFLPPHVQKLVLACTNMFLMLMSSNTLYLWLPQLFQEINDYQYGHNGSSSDICKMMESLTPSSSNTTSCKVNLENSSVYTNAMMIGLTRMVGFAVAGVFVNLIGKKTLVVMLAATAGCFSTSIYFARNTYAVLALAALSVMSTGICQNLLVTTTLEMFPTSVRTIALSMHMTSGRIGTVLGNTVFPSLLYAGCFPPFVFLGSLAFACAILASFYPNTENKALE